MAQQTANANVKSVGGNKKGEGKAKGEKKGKGEGKGRPAYNYSKAVDADGKSIVSDEGKLLAIPQEVTDGEGKVVQEAYSFSKHKPLGKDDFASGAVFHQYRAEMCEHRAGRLMEQAKSHRNRSKILGSFKDEKSRKKAEKAQRMREQLAKLQAELAEEGIDLEETTAETE